MFIDMFFNLLALFGSMVLVGLIIIAATVIVLLGSSFIDALYSALNSIRDKKYQ